MVKIRCIASQGFSLLEATIAATILLVGIGALTQLFLISAHANRGSRIATFASVLAEEKMEQLRGLAWGFDDQGLPVSDITTDTSVVPESPVDGTGLGPSPIGALGRNTAGYCDFLDGAGRSLGGGESPPDGTVFIRRWSVEPLPANPYNTIVLQVLVTATRDRGASGGTDAETDVRRLPDEARLVGVKTRKVG